MHQELNTNPTQSFDRYIISFVDFRLEKAAQWPEMLGYVRVCSDRQYADGSDRRYGIVGGKSSPRSKPLALDQALHYSRKMKFT